MKISTKDWAIIAAAIAASLAVNFAIAYFTPGKQGVQV